MRTSRLVCERVRCVILGANKPARLSTHRSTETLRPSPVADVVSRSPFWNLFTMERLLGELQSRS